MSNKTHPFKSDPGSALSNMESLRSHLMEVTKGKHFDLKSKQTKRALLTTSERANKRFRRGQSTDMKTNSLSHHTDLCTIRTADRDYCESCHQGEAYVNSDTGNDCVMKQEEMGTENDYTCPLGEFDLDSDDITDSESSGSQEHLENPKSSLSSDILREQESSCQGSRVPFLITTDISSSSPAVNSNVNPFASQPDKTQTPRNIPNKCDMEQEETDAQNNMWKLRANRVKQILFEFGPFTWSEKVGLEFNVGFAPKQNISVDSFRNFALPEVAKFALAMNSSQQYFIMEILEYNFDLSFWSKDHRNIFTFEIMETVRQLKNSQDADKRPGEVFDSPHLMMERDQEVESVSSVNLELSSVSRKEGCDVAPVRYPQSHAETKERMSWTMVDPYPFCKEIGLKLHFNQCQQNKKLDFSKLTNEALTEVANFAEKLCGTFEEIYLDILRHNLDLGLQSGDSDLARSILARTPFVMERKNLSTCIKAFNNLKRLRRDSSTNVKLDCQPNSPKLDACSAGSSQATTVYQNVDSPPEPEKQKELNSMLWKLRANHIQEILSIPHVEHCPLYSYFRCKKLGIDFNVGSGVKQNLDPKLLTNGIMVEICIFAIELLSAQRYFITDILEYNFHLEFSNELHRSAFAQQTCDKIVAALKIKRYSVFRMNMQFELPDLRCIEESTTYCPKCYQVRNDKLHQDESDPGHVHQSYPHTMTNEVSADADHTAQKPAHTITAEETIMGSYPLCKKIGLSLFVNKDQPKDKLDKQVLTHGIVAEVAKFAGELCATKNKIIRAVLEHNFNVGPQRLDLDVLRLFHRVHEEKVGELAWFSEVFVPQLFSHRQPGHASKLVKAPTMQISERKKTINERKLALQKKKERATLSSPNTRMTNSKTDSCSKVPANRFSYKKRRMGRNHSYFSDVDCLHGVETNEMTWSYDEDTEFSTDPWSALPMCGSPVMEDCDSPLQGNIHIREEEYDPHYGNMNPELDTGTTVLMSGSLENEACCSPLQENIQKIEEEFDPHYGNMKPEPDTRTIVPMSGSLESEACSSPLQGNIKIKEEEYNPHYGNMNPELDTGTTVPMSGSLVSVACGSPLQENSKIKEEEYNPHYGNMKPEPDTEEKYCPQYDDVKTEPDTEVAEHSVPGEPTEPFGNTPMILWPNSERPPTETENQHVQYYILTYTQGSAVWPNTEKHKN